MKEKIEQLKNFDMEEIQEYLEENTEYALTELDIIERIKLVEAEKNPAFWANNKSLRGDDIILLVTRITEKLYHR